MNHSLWNLDVAAMERATLAAIAPDEVVESRGWLMARDGGTLRRARSAVPLAHGPNPGNGAAREAEWATCLAAVPAVLSFYRARCVPPLLRIPLGCVALEEAAQALGLSCSGAYAVMATDIGSLARTSHQPHSRVPPSGFSIEVREQPDADWASLFLGDGLDPVDGASRVEHLSRASCNRYVTVRSQGEPVACGAAALAHGWLGCHGMRTARSHRGAGWAGVVLRAMADVAQHAGLKAAFLQVELENAPALAAYQRVGFHRVWRYAYWHE